MEIDFAMFTIPEATKPFLIYWQEFGSTHSTIPISEAVAAFEAGWRAAESVPLAPETLALLHQADAACESAERTIASAAV